MSRAVLLRLQASRRISRGEAPSSAILRVEPWGGRLWVRSLCGGEVEGRWERKELGWRSIVD